MKTYFLLHDQYRSQEFPRDIFFGGGEGRVYMDIMINFSGYNLNWTSTLIALICFQGGDRANPSQSHVYEYAYLTIP